MPCPNVPASQDRPIAQLALMMYDSNVIITHPQLSICVKKIKMPCPNVPASPHHAIAQLIPIVYDSSKVTNTHAQSISMNKNNVMYAVRDPEHAR